jgi:hypothetical protein
MNLHAAAKPLMKLMYHQAVLGFIRDNKEIPLSPTSAEIYLSYLSYENVMMSSLLANFSQVEICIVLNEGRDIVTSCHEGREGRRGTCSALTYVPSPP